MISVSSNSAFVLVLLCFAAVVLSCPSAHVPIVDISPGQLRPQLEASVISSVEDHLKKDMQKFVKSEEASNETKVIMENNKKGALFVVNFMGTTLRSGGFGLEDAAGQKGVQPEDVIFNSGYAAKLVVLLQWAAAIEDGLAQSFDVQVQDLVSTIIDISGNDQSSSSSSETELKVPDLLKGVTIRQLLSHRGGVPRDIPCWKDDTMSHATDECDTTTLEVLSRLADIPPVSRQWGKPHYSNLGYALAGNLLAEAAYGMDWKTLMTSPNSVLVRFNLTKTSVDYSEDGKAAGPLLHATPGSPDGKLVDLKWGAPSEQLYTTVADLAKIADLFAHYAPNYVPGAAEKLRKMTMSDITGDEDQVGIDNISGNGENVIDFIHAHALSDVFADCVTQSMSGGYIYGDNSVALSMPFEVSLANEHRIFSIVGDIGGHQSFLAAVPDLGLSVVVVWNTGKDIKDESVAMTQGVIASITLARKAIDDGRPPSSEVDVAALTGSYTSQAGSQGISKFKITGENSDLHIKFPMGVSAQLVPVENSDMTYKIIAPMRNIPCHFHNILTFTGEILKYEVSRSGDTIVTMPTLLPGVQFVKS